MPRKSQQTALPAPESRPDPFGGQAKASPAQAPKAPQGAVGSDMAGFKVEFIPKEKALAKGLRGVPVDRTVERIIQVAEKAKQHDSYARVHLDDPMTPSAVSAMRRQLKARGIACRMSPKHNEVVVWGAEAPEAQPGA